MAALPDYVLNLQGIRHGENPFHFKLGNEFFRLFDYGIISEGNLRVSLIVFRESEAELSVHADVEGDIVCNCDRCARELKFPTQNSGTLLIKLTDLDIEDTDEIWHWSPAEKNLDLSKFIYELISLSKPLRTVCEMIEGQSCYSGTDELLDKYKSGGRSRDEENPIWEQLKGIKFDKG